jgi:MoaA/NifB/PqqE/SkfB family radical SAM enzyme
MKKPTYLIGRKRQIYTIYIEFYVLIYFLIQMIFGKFPAKNFGRFLKRLLFFLSKMKDNKFVKIGKYTKISLYVPAFPSESFFKACRKVMLSEDKMPCITVLLSVTSACRYKCEHCYQKLDIGKDVDINLLIETTQKLDRMGVSFFNIEGGEPFLVFDRLKKVCEAVGVGEIWINSTGDGMTEEKLQELKRLGVKGFMFSLHSPDPDKIVEFMKNDKAWENMKNGIALCHKLGFEVAANTCILKDDYFNGTFDRILEKARELGISIIQLIKPKPSGGWLGSELAHFSRKELDEIERMVLKYNNAPENLSYPFIAAQIIDERSDMFGCTAGGTDRFYINAKGDVQPCEFLNISYGNIKEEEFEIIYQRMRNSFNVPGSNWLCESCSANISELVKIHGVKSLPLSKELSELVINNWDRGSEPDFYEKVVKL